jgi:hypothetical protein
MKNLEICQEILFGRPLSEIPPNPPFIKGGRGDFWDDGFSEVKPLGVASILGFYPYLEIFPINLCTM